MNALSLSTSSPLSLFSSSRPPASSTRYQFSLIQFPKLGSRSLKLPRTQFRPSFKSPNQLSAADDEEETEEFDDDDEAADEYVEVSGEEMDIDDDLEDEDGAETQVEEELSTSFWSSNESKFQRVKKLCDTVRELGAGIIDADELAYIYDFRIDKFQVPFFPPSELLKV